MAETHINEHIEVHFANKKDGKWLNLPIISGIVLKDKLLIMKV
jgi:hypothetical protein